MPLAIVTPDQLEGAARDTERVSLVSELGPQSNLPGAEIIIPWSRHGEAHHRGGLEGDHRLVTLTGPAGSGKSRLAVEVARNLLNHFYGWSVVHQSCSLSGSISIDACIRESLGYPIEQSARSDTLENVIKARGPLLLVFDNAEHLLDDCAEYILRLMEGTSQAHFLTTTRSPLNIEGEATIEIGPLPTQIGVELFMARARQANPKAVSNSESIQIVTDLVDRLDGLSLAIELAAARLRSMSLEQLHERLSLRFQLLQSERRDQDARQRTMRSAIDWSGTYWNRRSGGYSPSAAYFVAASAIRRRMRLSTCVDSMLRLGLTSPYVDWSNKAF